MWESTEGGLETFLGVRERSGVEGDRWAQWSKINADRFLHVLKHRHGVGVGVGVCRDPGSFLGGILAKLAWYHDVACIHASAARVRGGRTDPLFLLLYESTNDPLFFVPWDLVQKVHTHRKNTVEFQT